MTPTPVSYLYSMALSRFAVPFPDLVRAGRICLDFRTLWAETLSAEIKLWTQETETYASLTLDWKHRPLFAVGAEWSLAVVRETRIPYESLLSTETEFHCRSVTQYPGDMGLSVGAFCGLIAVYERWTRAVDECAPGCLPVCTFYCEVPEGVVGVDADIHIPLCDVKEAMLLLANEVEQSSPEECNRSPLSIATYLNDACRDRLIIVNLDPCGDPEYRVQIELPMPTAIEGNYPFLQAIMDIIDVNNGTKVEHQHSFSPLGDSAGDWTGPNVPNYDSGFLRPFTMPPSQGALARWEAWKRKEGAQK